MSQARTTRFDGWLLRMDLGELSKDGRKIRLQAQPLQVLDELLAHPGELVTREQLIARLWPKGVVDFDTGLNTAVRKLRIALQDEAETPRYIETLPRKGYRFIGKIDDPAPPTSTPPSATASYGRVHIYVGASVALLIAGLTFMGLRREASQAVTHPAAQTAPAHVGATTLAVLPMRTSSSDESGVLIAQSVADLIRNRLAALNDLTVIASSSTTGLVDVNGDMGSVGEKLRAQFLLKGSTDRVGERLRVVVELVDARAGKQLWTRSFERPIAEVGTVLEEIFQRVAGSLGISVGKHEPSQAAINLDAHQLYMQGQQLLADSRATDAERTVELFRRAAILDPTFARAYVALGQALLAQMYLLGTESPDLRAQAAQAFDRALQLNPALGEARIEQARLTPEPAKAEALYRKGLELAPNYAQGYAHYSGFLFDEIRVGEAIDMIRRAREIDPLSPDLHLRHAGLVMVGSSDVATHDQLVREALAINPGLAGAHAQLAFSRWEFSGEFADAAQLVERALAIDPESPRIRMLGRDIYLDLGDPVAAVAILGEAPPPAAMVEIAQYRGDREHAARLMSAMRPDLWTDSGAHAANAAAIRDGAIAKGDFGPAIKIFEAAHEIRRAPRMHYRAMTLVYAHTLSLAGEVERGAKLAEVMLAQINTHSVGRTPNWFSRDRAAVFAVLGDDERALEELEISVRNKRLYRWWYLAERDPLYTRFRNDPRFKALATQAKQHFDRQRAVLEDMRRKGEVPLRAQAQVPLTDDI